MCTARSAVDRLDIIAQDLASIEGPRESISVHTTETIEKLIAVLDQHDANNTAINMTRWTQFWAFDVMSKLAFGESLGFLHQGYDFNGMIQAQRENFRYISVANNFPLLDALTKRNPFLKLFKKKPSMFFTFARRVVRERLDRAAREDADMELGSKQSQRSDDLLGSFITARKAYPLMDEQRLTHLSATNVLAGANNSARAMDVTINWLANHPEEQERLYEEITAVNVAAMTDAETAT